MVEKEKTVEEQVLMITLKWAIPVILVIILLTGFYIIPAGNRGVLLTFGKPEVQAVGEGLHYKIPLVQKIVRMSIQTQKYEADASASSSDLQVVTSKIATKVPVFQLFTVMLDWIMQLKL